MFSAPLLRYEVAGGAVEPRYLDGRYAELVRTLIIHYEVFTGRPHRELQEALAALPDVRCHESRLVAGLRRVIEEAVELAVEAPVEPRRIRAAVFALGRRDLDLAPEAVYLRAAAELGAQGLSLAEHLYADLRPERRVRFSTAPPPVTEVISRYNFRLLQGLLLCALRLRVEVHEHARSIYRFARLHGLLVEAKRPEAGDGPLILEITGPLSLFQRTRKYGLALARFLPACAAASRFRLEALVHLRDRDLTLTVTQADRVLSSHRPPQAFDSKLEERFYRDFVRLASRWDIAREAELIRVGSTVFLPDFTFTLRADPSLRVDLEIAGFWTRDYLARKLALMEMLRQEQSRQIIFCIDRKLCCDREPSPFPCLAFSGRVPAAKVLEILESVAAGK